MTSGARKSFELICTALHNAQDPRIVCVNKPQSRNQNSIKENAGEVLQALKAHSTQPISLATQCNKFGRCAQSFELALWHAPRACDNGLKLPVQMSSTQQMTTENKPELSIFSQASVMLMSSRRSTIECSPQVCGTFA